MYFPIEKELISVIPGNKFVKFTDKFKYHGTYLAHDLYNKTGMDQKILRFLKSAMP
jgi:hypothetical protein